MTIEGTPVFNALTILEIERIDYREGTPALSAHAAFVNTNKDTPSYGRTHGSTTCRLWSRETLAKLEELRSAMEQDMAKLHFAEEQFSAPSSAGPSTSGISEWVTPGIDDATSV